MTLTITYIYPDGLQICISKPPTFQTQIMYILPVHLTDTLNSLPLHLNQSQSFSSLFSRLCHLLHDSTVQIVTTIYPSIRARHTGVHLLPPPHICLLSPQIQSLLLSKCHLNPTSLPFSLLQP